MKYLLDTHCFLWAITNDSRMSTRARAVFLDAGNKLYLSVASLWEIAIKVRLGRLHLPEPAERYLRDQMSRNTIQLLPIEPAHAFRLFHLPDPHRDPFDRMIIAQSLEDRLPIVTADPLIGRYAVESVW